MGKTNIFVTNMTIKHLYISTLELTRNHMKIIDLHAVNVTIQLDKVQTGRNKMVHSKVRFKCEFCDYTATTEYLIQVHRISHHEGSIFHCGLCDFKITI